MPILTGFNDGEIRSLRFLLPPPPASGDAYTQEIRARYGCGIIKAINDPAQAAIYADAADYLLLDAAPAAGELVVQEVHLVFIGVGHQQVAAGLGHLGLDPHVGVRSPVGVATGGVDVGDGGGAVAVVGGDEGQPAPGEGL